MGKNNRFQKAIKKVRAVQRMRRNRGFAFSQTEDPSRPQDQARLIRAYDTSARERPSGYWTNRESLLSSFVILLSWCLTTQLSATIYRQTFVLNAFVYLFYFMLFFFRYTFFFFGFRCLVRWPSFSLFHSHETETDKLAKITDINVVYPYLRFNVGNRKDPARGDVL